MFNTRRLSKHEKNIHVVSL